jgi:hypothetical protein
MATITAYCIASVNRNSRKDETDSMSMGLVVGECLQERGAAKEAMLSVTPGCKYMHTGE